MWKDMLDDYGVSAAAESQTKYLHKLDENVRAVYFVVSSVSLGLLMHITSKYSASFDLIQDLLAKYNICLFSYTCISYTI